MKQTKLWLTTIAVLLCSLTASAHDFEVDGIYYNITSSTDHTIEVTSSDGTEYYGSITLPATVTHNDVNYSVTSIGDRAFFYCSSLTAITIPDGVTSIGDDAFFGCSSLTAITLPDGVTSIGGGAFYGCSSLTTITIPEGVTSIGEYAFYSCSSLAAIVVAEGNTTYDSRNGCNAIIETNSNTLIQGCSATIIPEGVTSIGKYAFLGCSLTSIIIPESVTSIGGGAFLGCSSLTTITLPESVTSIGGGAFSGCSSLTTITIPEGVTSIGARAFYGCSKLTAITIPEGVTSIGDNAFAYCSSLTAITLPEGVTSIGKYAFLGCSLTAINIPKGVTSIGNNAFYNCSSLKTVINYSDLPLQRGSNDYGYVAYYADRVIDADEVIDGYAFKTIEGVHYLIGYIGDKTELTLPADYKDENYQIGGGAFSGCSSLTAITIPENSQLTSFGEYAFYSCSSLTAITIPASVTSIGEFAFYGCSNLIAINIPEGVTSIGEFAFAYCSSLTTITILEGVTSIGECAFYYCSSLKELTLGKGIRKIESRAFYGCTVLEKVTAYATRPPTAADINIFSDATYENATLYVPQGCIDKYQVMTGWSSFYTIEEMEGGTPNYLTLRQADNGEVGIVVDLGRTYKVRITAFEGWTIHSVTFNGEEVTAQLTEEGTFTTPALQVDAVLNIAYEKTDNTTMVANTTARAIKVQGHRGTLRITGATEGEAISVYTTGGTLVAQESAEEGETLLTLSTGQVYIVTVAHTVVKIGM